MAALSFKLCLLLAFLSSTLLPISAFTMEKRKVLNKIRAINNEGPYYGLIAASRSVEKAFMATDGFDPDSKNPFVDIAGRRFHIGVVENKNVVFVTCGFGMVNAAATTQLLLDYFEIAGVVHFGVSGSTNISLGVGDVIVPKEFVNTGLWDWLNPDGKTPSNDVASLEISDYNMPEGGSNKLGKIAFSTEEFYSESEHYVDGNVARRLWFPVSDYYLEIASKLEDTKLENCVGKLPSVSCLSKAPAIVRGLKGSTSNSFIDNAAYGKFLRGTFDVASTDMESSAVVMTCLSNGKENVVVIRGLSNLAGGLEDSSEDDSAALFQPLATTNVVKVVVDFVKELPFILQHAQA